MCLFSMIDCKHVINTQWFKSLISASMKKINEQGILQLWYQSIYKALKYVFIWTLLCQDVILIIELYKPMIC